MALNGSVKRFQKLKVITIEQLAGLLEFSVITARRQLKKWALTRVLI